LTTTESAVHRKDAAVHVIRQAILRGELGPDQRLVEHELSGRFSVARAAVREALLQLECEGLVERRPNRGARVRSISLEEASHILEARAALEGVCAARAAVAATREDRNRLRRTGKDMADAVAAGDLLSYSALSEDLHGAIQDLSRQPTIDGLLDRLRNQSVRYHFHIALLPGYLAQGLAEHIEVIDAVSSRDADVAERVMRDHLLSVRETLQRLKDRLPGPPPGRTPR
jgi:DNA-binding GntR family transcriptional regulator